MKPKSKRFEKPAVGSFGLKKNDLLRVRLDSDLRAGINKAIDILNNNSYLDVSPSSFARQALRYYINIVNTQKVGLAFLEPEVNKQSKNKTKKDVEEYEED